MKWKWKITSDAPNNRGGLIQMITMGKSMRHKWVKEKFSSDEAERNGLWSGFDNMLARGTT